MNLNESLFLRYLTPLLFAALLCFANGGLLYAGNWQALIVSNPGAGAETANADAADVSQGFIANGITQTTLLRNATEADLDAALTSLYGVSDVLIYIAAPYADGTVTLADIGLEIPLILERLKRGGTKNIGLLYENCAQNSPVPLVIDAPTSPDGIELMFSTSAKQGESCPKSGARLTDALTPRARGGNLQSRIGPNRITAGADFPKIPMQRDLSINSIPEIPVVSGDMVTLSPAIMVNLGQPAEAAITPVSLTPSSDPLPEKEVVVFSVPNEDELVATPLIEGRPRPFLILGTITDENADQFGPIEQTIDLAKVDFGYADLDQRRAFKQEDPEMFEKLVAGGALDPPSDQLAVALQTELKRMGCYRARIDGDWGRGSQAAMRRYFDQAKVDRVASADPSARLFRQILLKDDITCPAPAPAATVRRQQPAPATRTRSSTRTRSQPARRQPQRTTRTQTTRRAPAPAPPPQQIRPGAAMGVFR